MAGSLIVKPACFSCFLFNVFEGLIQDFEKGVGGGKGPGNC